MSNALRAAHFYRKVPKELTDSTSLGGLVSLTGIVVAVVLVGSITSSYLTTSLRTRLELDLQTHEFIDLAFNITLDRLPCRFSSIDLFDGTGTKRLNITQDLTKVRVSSGDGHILGVEEREEWTDEILEGGAGEAAELAAPKGGAGKAAAPLLTAGSFAEFMAERLVVLVAFGAPWCPWSQRLEPVWAQLYNSVHEDEVLSVAADIARVDCTVEKQLCQEQQIHAFPTIRIYRAHATDSHEEYRGDRSEEELFGFLQEQMDMIEEEDVNWHPLTHLTHISGEGCQVSGHVRISRVPGSLRISAQSAVHSFDPLNMNVTHHVDALVFKSPDHELEHRIWHADQNQDDHPVGELSLRKTTFVMHEQATTLKHFLKVVPTRRVGRAGDGLDTYEYSTAYNEFQPADLRPHAHSEAQRLVPMTVFSYDISPYRVVHREASESVGSYLTQLCAVVGGVFTVFGIIDGLLYNGLKAMKQD